MKFYDCRTAPSPRRVRIFIAEKGIEIETIEVDLGSKEQLSSEFKKINPKEFDNRAFKRLPFAFWYIFSFLPSVNSSNL